MPWAHYMTGGLGDLITCKMFYGYSYGGKTRKLQFKYMNLTCNSSFSDHTPVSI